MDSRTSSLPAPPALPRRHIRWLASVARIALWLVVTFWLLFGASWGLLHGWIVPRIGEFRPHLESVASKALGMPVRIGQISAQSGGMIPSFELRDVVLLDAGGREALRLPRLQAALSPASLWSLGFEQLLLDQPALEIRRAADGKVYVGGLDISQQRGDSNAAADWFFSQTEFSIRGGTVRWIDELRQAPPLALAAVDAVIRNGHRRHLMRLDATPPPEWGERFTLRGIFRQPLFSVNAGRWTDWSGQLFADFSRVDASLARRYVVPADIGMVEVAGGQGSLRAWVDVKSGAITGGTADVALTGVDARFDKDLKPLALAGLEGRFEGQKLANGFRFSTEALRFTTREGLQWPGGNLALSYTGAEGQTGQKVELKADKLDLAALAQIANRLPLGTSTHAMIASYSPKGLLETVEGHWQDQPEAASPSAAARFAARGRVTGFEVASLASGKMSVSTPTHPLPGRPGISGATLDFDLTQAGGKAGVTVVSGALDLPGVFEDSRVPFDRLSMDVQWKLEGEKIDTQLRNIKFANVDAEGQAQASWRSSDAKEAKAALAKGHDPSLGMLDLQGSLSRGDGSRVHRYLPLVLPEHVRHYVRDAVVKGDVNDVKFKVKGPVDRIPYSDPTAGEFRISTKVKNGLFAYVPKTILAKDAVQWPALNDVRGELVFNRAALEVNAASARFVGLAGLQAVRVEARIPDLMHSATVEVDADLKGLVGDVLAYVNSSPVGSMTGGVLAKTRAGGAGDYALRLNLPLNSIDQSRVQGTISLPGNDVQLAPATPLLGRLKGVATFNENGFNILGAQARVLGGDIRFEGGTRAPLRTGAAAAAAGTPAPCPAASRAAGCGR